MKAIFTVGVSACGKTTWAEQQEGFVNINRDDIRFEIIMGGVRDFTKYKFNGTNEKRVTEIQRQEIANAISEKKDIIISDTNLNPKNYDRWVDMLDEAGYEIEFKRFDITLNEAIMRDARRANPVGYSVIARQMEQYNALFHHIKQDPSLPTAVIVDIDGTLAHMEGRGPFEWDKVYQDSVDKEVRDIVNGLSSQHVVIVMSGRDEVCREDTTAWLKDNGVWYNRLHMRPAGDMRKDSIIKREMFDKFVADKYNVVMVIDDRPQVVNECWRKMGLKVIQVGNPYIEF